MSYRRSGGRAPARAAWATPTLGPSEDAARGAGGPSHSALTGHLTRIRNQGYHILRCAATKTPGDPGRRWATLQATAGGFLQAAVLVNVPGTIPKRRLDVLSLEDSISAMMDANLNGRLLCACRVFCRAAALRGSGRRLLKIGSYPEAASPQGGPAYLSVEFGPPGLTQASQRGKRGRGNSGACAWFPPPGSPSLSIHRLLQNARWCRIRKARDKMGCFRGYLECVLLCVNLPPARGYRGDF